MLDQKQLAQIHEAGFQAEKNERGCAQCILLAVKDRYDVPPEVFKAASGLSGGVALTGEGPCGAGQYRGPLSTPDVCQRQVHLPQNVPAPAFASDRHFTSA